MAKAAKTKKQTSYQFEAQVDQVLSLVINSLYSNKEIFLRELVSNASDALDRLKFRSLTDHALVADTPLEIRIEADEDAGTITIADTGVGMNEEELRTNLGTIAHSGTQAFVKALEEAKGDKDLSLIGQFGVGFYSSYLVADRVEVISRSAGADNAWRWESTGKSEFTLEESERETHGTSIVLHIREEQKELLSTWKLRELIGLYSDYVSHPVLLEEMQYPTGEDETEEPTKKFVQVNSGQAMWQRSKNDVTDEEYVEFYKHLCHDWEEPLAHKHFKVEGTQLFTGLLFVPSRAPFDLFSAQHRRGVRLYVKRVFIMDDCEELIPQWLRFMKGIVDSDDLPLNVSRELLQDSRLVQSISKQIVKKSLDCLDELSKDETKYTTFWETFGAVLKEGIHFSQDHQARLAKLARFKSSSCGDDWTTLDAYIERMPEDQTQIYYVIAESIAAAAASPHLESLRAKGYEVLFMTDTIDEWATQRLNEYEGKQLISAMKATFNLEESEEEKAQKAEKETELKSLVEKAQEVLGDRVKEVRLSSRLTQSPACLVVPEGGVHAHLERLMRENDMTKQAQHRIFELNPDHALVQGLKKLQEVEGKSEQVGHWIRTLYDQAVLTEGGSVEDPAKLAQTLAGLMVSAVESEL
jgi:molecular chaperone HtpG